jgi:dihydroneopterin aldolase
MTISLHQVKFYGYHGLYEEEKKLGNTFIVDLSLNFTPPSEGVTDINQTVDYVSVYELVKARMEIPTPLLETIVNDIANSVLQKFPIAQNITIQITKAQVYIKNLEGNMSVSLTKSRI